MNIISRKDKSWDNKNLPTSKKWKYALHEIYIKYPGGYGRGHPRHVYNSEFQKSIGVNDEDYNQIIMLLDGYKLITLDSHEWFGITEKGFDIALQNERIKSDMGLKRWLTIFTAILILIGIIQIILILIKG